MKQDHLDPLSLDQLVTMFTEMAIEQSKAMFAGDSKKYNRLLDQMIEVEAALKALPGDQRRALLPLHNHRNAQVRLMAAIATLEQEPKASRQCFRFSAIAMNIRRLPMRGVGSSKSMATIAAGRVNREAH